MCVGGSFPRLIGIPLGGTRGLAMDTGGGAGGRDPNDPNLDNGILKGNENPDTIDKRKALGIIDIQVGDLLIPGNDVL